jgi:hypothetical protein
MARDAHLLSQAERACTTPVGRGMMETHIEGDGTDVKGMRSGHLDGMGYRAIVRSAPVAHFAGSLAQSSLNPTETVTAHSMLGSC